MTRALEPVHSDVLTELANIGVGRTMSILGDMIGVHLSPVMPEVRFVTMGEDALFGGEELDARPSVVATEFHGSLSAYVAMIVPPATSQYLAASLHEAHAIRHDRTALHASAAMEMGSIVLASLLDAFSPVLPRRGWYSSPRLLPDPHAWWRQVGRTAVGGFSVSVTLEDDQRRIQGQFLTLMGTRALDQVLRSCEACLDAAEAMCEK